MQHSLTHTLLLLLCMLTLNACRDDFSNTPAKTSKLVVDGYIESGKFAKVILTNSLPIQADIDSSKYLDIVTTRAKISISNGIETEVLTLSRDNNSFPPHYYASTSIIGEAGKTYSLEIIYQNDTIRAKTSIPEKVTLQKVWSEVSKTDSSQYYVWINFCDKAHQKDFYRIFTQIKGKQRDFIPTYISAFNDDLINGRCQDIPLFKGVENFFDKTNTDTFTKGDTVFIKICSIDEVSYNFWKNYDKEIFNTGNPFAGHGSNLETNISGGIGIWSGYNSSIYSIIVK